MDHYVPELPNYTDTYYPDGQVRDEDYVYSSFLMSRMYMEGVHCMDCHKPHSARLQLEGDALCMRCHVENTLKIDPTTHSYHRFDNEGARCVNCHMPTTVYMQRQPRRDQQFFHPRPPTYDRRRCAQRL